MNNHRKGLALTTAGGLALSFDVPLVRLGSGDVWSTIGLRSIVTFVLAMGLCLAVRAGGRRMPPLLPGWPGAAAALCYGLSTISFLGAVFQTATANVVFILAFTPMFSALMIWLAYRERPSPATFVTMLVMVCGVGVIVGGGLAGGHVLGDLLAALTALFIAVAITIGHGTRADMGFVPLVATILPAVIGLSISVPNGFSVPDPVWVILDGAVTIPLAAWCLATGPKYLTGPEVGMFYLLETVLAPIWVWMIFSEVPTIQTLVGGAILILALVGYSLHQMRAKRASSVAQTA